MQACYEALDACAIESRYDYQLHARRADDVAASAIFLDAHFAHGSLFKMIVRDKWPHFISSAIAYRHCQEMASAVPSFAKRRSASRDFRIAFSRQLLSRRESYQPSFLSHTPSRLAAAVRHSRRCGRLNTSRIAPTYRPRARRGIVDAIAARR